MKTPRRSTIPIALLSEKGIEPVLTDWQNDFDQAMDLSLAIILGEQVPDSPLARDLTVINRKVCAARENGASLEEALQSILPPTPGGRSHRAGSTR